MPSLRWQLQHSDEHEAASTSASASKQQQALVDPEGFAGGAESGDAAAAPPAAAATSFFSSLNDLPSLDSAYAKFIASHPRFIEAEAVDEAREAEYPHLRDTGRACFDYCGFGLFTSSQQRRSDFALTAAPASSLSSAAAYGFAEHGTLEAELRRRVIDYLNVDDSYRLVFAPSKRAAFALLAAAYDFSARPKLLSVYDHESESVRALVTAARAAKARVSAAAFRWPELQICGNQLAAALKSGSSRRGGLFVYPTQSRLTGTKYSYQWMTLAQKHRWDVLLDVSAMGPKDMGSLGLSLFRPDFIVCSFYKVFGADPTGFGCLLIKDSSLSLLRAVAVAGMVRIVAAPAAAAAFDGYSSPQEVLEGLEGLEAEDAEDPSKQQPVIAFSGPVLGASPTSSTGSFAFHPQVQSTTSSELGHGDAQDEEEAAGVQEDLGENGYVEKQPPLQPRTSTECEIEELDERSYYSEATTSAAAAAVAPVASTSEHQNGSLQDDDAALRKISRDDGLIDSRRSDMFRRFLPIREDIEEEGSHLQRHLQAHTLPPIRGSRGHSSSWDDYYYDDEEDFGSEDEDWDEEVAREPLIICRALDQASALGLNRINVRHKCLMDWLISSLSSLVHRIPVKRNSNEPSSSSSSTPSHRKQWKHRPLVNVFGPKSQPDRGPAVAFNIYDVKGTLVQPSIVQSLADRAGIALGVGCLSNVFVEENDEDRLRRRRIPEKCSFLDVHHDSNHCASSGRSMKRMSTTPVVTATLALVSNFEDVYRLWTFVARFLDPGFVNEEVLKYQSLNQETVVVTGG